MVRVLYATIGLYDTKTNQDPVFFVIRDLKPHIIYIYTSDEKDFPEERNPKRIYDEIVETNSRFGVDIKEMKEFNQYEFQENKFNIAKDIVTEIDKDPECEIFIEVTGGRVGLSYALSSASILAYNYMNKIEGLEIKGPIGTIKPKGRHEIIKFPLLQDYIPNSSEINILQELENHEDQNDLGEVVGLKQSTVSRYIGSLEKNDYVEVHGHTRNRTRKGNMFLELDKSLF